MNDEMIDKLTESIARERVEAEDAEARKRRINSYKKELTDALNKIQEAQKSKEETLELIFSNGKYEKAERVHAGLVALHIECSDITSRQGPWENGVGYSRYTTISIVL